MMAATYDDLVALDLPEWQIGEIIDGRIVVRRLPPPLGVLAFSSLLWMVVAERRRLRWQILPRVELCLGTDVLVPDMSGWRYETMPKVLNVPWIDLPPEWVCDVVSPDTESLIPTKAHVYARHGVVDRWILDPQRQKLDAFQLEPDGWHLRATHSGNEVVRIAPFPEIELELALLWDAPSP
jgi:Uma2 family endonuclease